MKEVRFYLGTNSLNVCRRDPPSLSRQLWEFLNDDPLCQKFWVMSKVPNPPSETPKSRWWVYCTAPPGHFQTVPNGFSEGPSLWVGPKNEKRTKFQTFYFRTILTKIGAVLRINMMSTDFFGLFVF